MIVLPGYQVSERIGVDFNTITYRGIRKLDCKSVIGPGMTEKVRQRLFDPFFTTKPVGKGTGLGLSISYQIVVEKHGGQLSCVSVPGQGAEFAIAIPIQQHN